MFLSGGLKQMEACKTNLNFPTTWVCLSIGGPPKKMWRGIYFGFFCFVFFFFLDSWLLGFLASRLLGFWASWLLGLSASWLLGFWASRLFGFLLVYAAFGGFLTFRILCIPSSSSAGGVFRHHGGGCRPPQPPRYVLDFLQRFN